jgi:hypothetical protein
MAFLLFIWIFLSYKKLIFSLAGAARQSCLLAYFTPSPDGDASSRGNRHKKRKDITDGAVPPLRC